jgi:hypothetical protein
LNCFFVFQVNPSQSFTRTFKHIHSSQKEKSKQKMISSMFSSKPTQAPPERAARRGQSGSSRGSGRSNRGQVQEQSMVNQQELEQVQRTERFLEQIGKATRNVRDYIDAVACGADDEAKEDANLIAGMSLRAMNMSSKALRKDKVENAIRLGRKKILEFYRENESAYAGHADAQDLFEQYTAYMRNVLDGKNVPRLPVAVPEHTTEEAAGRHLNDTVGHLLGGFHGVDEGDRRTAENFESVKERHARMLRETDEKGDDPRLGRVQLDANKFNQHVRGEKVVFDREHMANAERAMKEQRYRQIDVTADDVPRDCAGDPCLGFRGEADHDHHHDRDHHDDDGDYNMGECEPGSRGGRGRSSGSRW